MDIIQAIIAVLFIWFIVFMMVSYFLPNTRVAAWFEVFSRYFTDILFMSFMLIALTLGVILLVQAFQ